MKKNYTITTTPAQFVSLAHQIASELRRAGRNVVTVKHPVFAGVYTLDMSWQEIERERAENIANYKGDARVFICAESERTNAKEN